jgi:hypothetical protein
MPRPIRLRQHATSTIDERAHVIDASFKVVGQRTLLGRIWRAILAVIAAALLGLLTPPAWLLAQRIGKWLGS